MRLTATTSADGAAASDTTLKKTQAHEPATLFRTDVSYQAAPVASMAAPGACLRLDSQTLEVFVVIAPKVGDAAARAQFDDASGESAHELTVMRDENKRARKVLE